MEDNIKKLIFWNTSANYALTITRFFTQIILTRILFLNLGELSYGFWALIWSIFGYSLLLDFGFGTSVQKYSAEVTVTSDYEKYGPILQDGMAIKAICQVNEYMGTKSISLEKLERKI